MGKAGVAYLRVSNATTMRYYIIAGEASGDVHGARLVAALRRQDPAAEVRCWGGDLMEAAGATLVKHYRELAIMGFVDVLKMLPTILRNLRFARRDIAAFAPDVVIHIDFSGFNLRVARWAKTAGYRTFYYISPQVWASRAGRVEQIRRYVDRLFVILPFESEFYARYGVEVEFVGHPLVDQVADFRPAADFRTRHALDPDRPLVALLPGSRKQEIERHLSVMLAAAERFPELQFAVAGARSQAPDYYAGLMNSDRVALVYDATYDLLAHADAALVTSGTATLETALFGVPLCVGYRGSRLNYWIAKQLITVPYISLVNLILQRPLVTELIQDDFTVDRLTAELRLLLDPGQAAVLREGYAELRQLLGEPGAAERAAERMVALLKD